MLMENLTLTTELPSETFIVNPDEASRARGFGEIVGQLLQTEPTDVEAVLVSYAVKDGKTVPNGTGNMFYAACGDTTTIMQLLAMAKRSLNADIIRGDQELAAREQPTRPVDLFTERLVALMEDAGNAGVGPRDLLANMLSH